jgi:hypothetical protein
MVDTINEYRKLCKLYHPGGMTRRKREKLDRLLKILTLDIEMDNRELLRDLKRLITGRQ